MDLRANLVHCTSDKTQPSSWMEVWSSAIHRMMLISSSTKWGQELLSCGVVFTSHGIMYIKALNLGAGGEGNHLGSQNTRLGRLGAVCTLLNRYFLLASSHLQLFKVAPFLPFKGPRLFVCSRVRTEPWLGERVGIEAMSPEKNTTFLGLF